jgi:CBS domain-containing protein
MKVKDVMKSDSLKVCTSETKLASVAKVMHDGNIGVLPVVDHANKVIGVITDRDVCLAFGSRANKSASDISVREILPASKIRTVKAEDDVKQLLKEMRTRKIGRMPVTDEEGKLKGMVSVNNLLSRAISNNEALGQIKSKDENLAKTIKSLFDRNASKVPVLKPTNGAKTK